MSARRGSHTRVSCDRCHDQKLRCERESNRTCCARCRRARAECILTAPTRRRARAGEFVFSKHCATLDGRGNNTPSPNHTAAPHFRDGGIAPLIPGISPAEAQPLDEKESKVPTAIKWTFAGHLTLPIDYSVKATAIDGHVDTNHRAPPESTRRSAETPSLRPGNRCVENSNSHSNLEALNTAQQAPTSTWSFATYDPPWSTI